MDMEAEENHYPCKCHETDSKGCSSCSSSSRRLSSNSLFQLKGDSSMHLLLLLGPTPLCLYPSMSVGRLRPCSCCSVPPYTSMLGRTRGTTPGTAALLINRVSSNVADAPQSKLLSSTRLPFTPSHLKSLGFKPSPPQLALLSLLFLLSMAIGAIFSLAVICLPTIAAFRRLGASVHKLSQVVSEEVPGTLSSLKLSAHEINELARQLTNLS
ncbi:uncharacterized protein LOC7477208 isoform X3 [Populus trichocarpa]|uniref:uncharacterized protein LOC7477208 isoform X3 n=1 Tax=Populus trichocarpa TaxID=3694 RepID=UPI0022788F6B|nr:uncharacterized protein LOC7477208 isoform X3 [Populus trichocarpa]